MKNENMLSILTFNIWALPGFFSNDKRKRVEAICQALNDIKYDVICLQEVWTKHDYLLIKHHISKVYPYHHYFYSGLLGSGLCIFSKWPIEECFYYRFPLNGHFYKIHQGDWCGGKGVGIAQISVQGIIVNIYITHLHAQYTYDDRADDYLAHRVIQSFDMSLFIKLTSQSADVSILAGDLNSDPNSLPIKILTYLAGLEDVFNAATTKEIKPETNDCFRNSYRCKKLESSFPGKRIDYILFKSKDDVKVNVLSCVFPLAPRVPNRSFSYSDHEAVGTCLDIQFNNQIQNNLSIDTEFNQKECLENALEVCENELSCINKNIRKHISLIGIVFVTFPFLFYIFDLRAVVCTSGTLTVCFSLLSIISGYQNLSWIKNAKKRIKLMSNQLKKCD